MEYANASLRYRLNYGKRERFETREVMVGNVLFGGNQPIRVQSMTTVDTMDVDASIKEAIRMIDAGCELVRLTAPSKKEAEKLGEIKAGLVAKGYSTPLVADIHFTPNAAEIASNHVEKIRVNPGNYADKKKFEEHTYTDETYASELIRIEEKFTPLVVKCKELGRAMRIGTNHGSLSDRILSRYGDTPEGMVESALEFIRICEKNNYFDLVISMKASNTLVMVQAYRLLVAHMLQEGMNYPIHLGVTEAGDGEDGRIKSAVGIGALLEDGIGDTIRVSLTENPEFEMPVARKLLEKFEHAEESHSFDIPEISYNPYHYQRRSTIENRNIGGEHVPVVFADLSSVEQIKPSHFFGFGYSYSVPMDKWNLQDLAADYVYLANKTIDFEVPGTLGLVVNIDFWSTLSINDQKKYTPYTSIEQHDKLGLLNQVFLEVNASNYELLGTISLPDNTVIVIDSTSESSLLIRKIRLILNEKSANHPVILKYNPNTNDEESFQLWSSSELGVHFIDGFGDGIWLEGNHSVQVINSTSFGILQATRTRISKTEYISCPSCGRTLFDLQETTAKIRQRTSHLKGIKIGIMGCIVNGPGEMADADYGYVGTGPGKINLYKKQEVVKRNIPEADAVDALIALIDEHGDWVEEK